MNACVHECVEERREGMRERREKRKLNDEVSLGAHIAQCPSLRTQEIQTLQLFKPMYISIHMYTNKIVE